MMNFLPNPRLAHIYKFFETYGSERLHGLSPSNFEGLNESEKEEVWTFLSERFSRSAERITALYNLDSKRAVEAFSKALESPALTSAYSDEREALEECRLLMLGYISAVASNEKFVALINEFAHSEFENIRAQFARTIAAHSLSTKAVEALKNMIFTEIEVLPLATAVSTFMTLHGMEFSSTDPLYRSIYRLLCSENPEEKRMGIRRLEEMRPSDCL